MAAGDNFLNGDFIWGCLLPMTSKIVSSQDDTFRYFSLKKQTSVAPKNLHGWTNFVAPKKLHGWTNFVAPKKLHGCTNFVAPKKLHGWTNFVAPKKLHGCTNFVTVIHCIINKTTDIWWHVYSLGLYFISHRWKASFNLDGWVLERGAWSLAGTFTFFSSVSRIVGFSSNLS